MLKKILVLGLAWVASVSWSFAQIMPSPARAEGEGPYEKLIIRGVTLIDGTGAPPVGPVDIVVEKNRITQIQAVGYPGVPINENRRPKADDKTKVMDLTGHYLLPGLIDMHGHIGSWTTRRNLRPMKSLLQDYWRILLLARELKGLLPMPNKRKLGSTKIRPRGQMESSFLEQSLK